LHNIFVYKIYRLPQNCKNFFKGCTMSKKSPTISNMIDNLRRVFQILNEQSKKVEKETGLTGPQLWAIKTINENSPINISDLANKLYLHPATVIGIIDRLEKQNFAKRQRSKDDRRVVWIELSEKGNRLLESAPEVAQGLLVSGLEKISATNLTEIDKSMAILVKIFGAQKTPPKLILSSEINVPKSPKLKKSYKQKT
jgi:MarR family transcriptional regulator, organic hydroperoxide resistance regulator